MKTRVLSAVVGIILLIIVLNFFETPILNIAIMVIALIAMHEFLTATRISHNRLLSAVAYFMAAVFPYVPMKKEMNLLPLFLLPYIALLFLILLKTHQDTRVEDIALVFMMSIGMTMSLSAAIYLRDNNGHVLGMYYLLLALFCAWFSDTGAYFTGKALGKHKLCQPAQDGGRSDRRTCHLRGAQPPCRNDFFQGVRCAQRTHRGQLSAPDGGIAAGVAHQCAGRSELLDD